MKKKSTEEAKRIVGFLFIVAVISFTACANPFEKEVVQEKETQQMSTGALPVETKEYSDSGFVVTGPDSYDSADTPIVVDINRDDMSITFLNLDINRRYTLSLDGTTKLCDKYGEGLSLEQIQIGDIVDITFLKSEKHLTSIQLSTKAWHYDNVERYEINTIRSEVSIGSEVYKLSENTQYLSAGRRIENIDLNPADVLSFQGIDNTVLTIEVVKGHGYLRLVNDENFVGGWIEIGQQQIQRVAEGMLLTVPEGSYQIHISHKGGGGTKDVVIHRNEETTLDIGDLAVAETQYGMVLFSLSPSDAELYIDGSEVDYSKPVTLEYGIHQIIAKADGYKSLTQYLRVGQSSAGIDVVLDKADAEEDTSSEAENASEEDASQEDATTGYYKVYIDAPESAEVYLDGNYVGIAPCSFKKTAGSHVIILRRSGYETRSYTVQIDDEERDTSYSFADLVQTITASANSAY